MIKNTLMGSFPQIWINSKIASKQNSAYGDTVQSGRGIRLSILSNYLGLRGAPGDGRTWEATTVHSSGGHAGYSGSTETSECQRSQSPVVRTAKDDKKIRGYSVTQAKQYTMDIGYFDGHIHSIPTMISSNKSVRPL
jgi:hypothetical protein